MRNKQISVDEESVRMLHEVVQEVEHRRALEGYREEHRPPRGFPVGRHPWIDLGGEGAP